MKFLGTLIVISSLISAGFMFFYFDTKLKEYRRNVLALKNQLSKTKSSTSTISPAIKGQSAIPKEVTITYTVPSFKYGITLPYTAVYLAPIDEGFIVNKLKQKLQVELIEEAEINKETWYFVSLGLNSNINSKGWIRKSQFSMFVGNNADITSMSYR